MRSAPINESSQYVAVRAFCVGSTLHHSMDISDRWKTYLATPIWWSDENGALLPAGVVVLASMWKDDESSLGSRHVTEISAALLEMHHAGLAVASPGGPVPV